ncbi:hypothetical protein CH330_09910 [candidate division WOR-3 bacterium JGI_Cruoil_03_51_56]|uniref:Septum formation initiator n=1 Tax=candidate division WOR-3 bacterium JGI_Cruoil_03_51_56 TaxID=1973747 RepID=A0A235BNU6_UNCW3|nr:MAG: hypothetical protein CH330_09910 [candidate division WOR-3 bacterium JGI_Cruoil_03_51_56]
MKPKTRHRRLWLVFLGILTLLLLIFLPGPNGLVKVLLKQHRAACLEQELRHMEKEIDSLNLCQRELKDSTFVREYLHECFSPLKESTSVK